MTTITMTGVSKSFVQRAGSTDARILPVLDRVDLRVEDHEFL